MEPRTFAQLIDDTLTQMGFAGETGRVKDVVAAAIRRSANERPVEQDYAFMRMPAPSLLSVTGGRASYALHPHFRAPIYFRWKTTGQPLVEAKSDMLLENGLPEYGATGEPGEYELRGQTNVARQPLTPGTVTVTAGAVDAVARTVTVEGVDTLGAYAKETLTITSPAAVATTTTSFHTVLWVRKQNTASVADSMTFTSGGTVLATLPPGSHGQTYRQLYLLRTPAGAGEIEYDFWRLPNDLTDDNAIPSIPAPFSNIHIYDALLETTGLSRPTGTEIQRWQDRQVELLHALATSYLEGQSNMAAASYVHYIPR